MQIQSLTKQELSKILECAKSRSLKSHLMLLLSYRYGLRYPELINLKWTQIDLEEGAIFIIRNKNDLSAKYHLEDDEIDLIKDFKAQSTQTHSLLFEALTSNQIAKECHSIGKECGIDFNFSQLRNLYLVEPKKIMLQ